MMRGEKVTGGTLFSATDPATYCAMANAGDDFIWTEMQHNDRDWERWRRCGDLSLCQGSAGCPRRLQRRARDQHALDAGALVIVGADDRFQGGGDRARNWTYFPPLGRRSNGGGQAFDGGDVRRRARGLPSGRSTTTWSANPDDRNARRLEGGQRDRQGARRQRNFAASGDLGNFSGFRQGTPDYERAINIVHDAQSRRESGGAVR